MLDPAPPRAPRAGAPRGARRGDPVEIVRALVHEPVAGASCRHAACSHPASSPLGSPRCASAGEHYFSEAWLDELRRGCTSGSRRAREAHPLDPGVPLAELLPAEPWAPHVLNLLEVERRGAKAYLPGAAAASASEREAAAELEAQLAQEEIAKVDDQRARRVPRGARPPAPRRRRLRRLDGALRPRPRLLADARPDHARRRSATRSASAAAPRNSCSSATTRTGSRAGWATPVYCGGARDARRAGRGPRPDLPGLRRDEPPRRRRRRRRVRLRRVRLRRAKRRLTHRGLGALRPRADLPQAGCGRPVTLPRSARHALARASDTSGNPPNARRRAVFSRPVEGT